MGSRLHHAEADLPADVAGQELAAPLAGFEAPRAQEVGAEVDPAGHVGTIHAIGGGADNVLDLHVKSPFMGLRPGPLPFRHSYYSTLAPICQAFFAIFFCKILVKRGPAELVLTN